MLPYRWLVTSAFALAMVGSACSADSPSSSAKSGDTSGAGGSTNPGGTASQVGSTGRGGSSAGNGGAGAGETASGSGGKGSGTTGTSGGAPGAGGASAGVGGKGSGTAGSQAGGHAGVGGTVSGSGGRIGAGGAHGDIPDAGGKGIGGSGAVGTDGSVDTGGGGYALKNDPVPSTGCGHALATTYKAGANTTYKMTSASLSREYILYIPSNYDSSKPYRLVFAFHCMGSSDTQCANSEGFYWLKSQDTGSTTIFVAPQGYTDSMPWRSDDKDHTFFDDMLKQFKSELCIDVSRVFAIGFSFGGMETYSLSVDHQKDLRAGVGIAPANYNIYVSNNKSHQPIAWMQTTGVNDTTCPWVNGSSTTQGSKFIAIEHGTDNGCTVPNPIPTWTSGNHLCVDFTGCKAGYPTKVCTFNGPHTDNSTESGSNWIPTEAWKFITQF